MNKIDNIINEEINYYINEYRYKDSDKPLNTRTSREANLGINPLASCNGNHCNDDTTGMPSTYDTNGASFVPTEKIVLPDGRFTFYKAKFFNDINKSGSMAFFGEGAKGEKKLRNTIDLLNGGAKRGERRVMFRIITSESNKEKAEKTGYLLGAFWEFSLNRGLDWYILEPDPLHKKMIKNTLKID